jgi:hypothetical protein
VRLFELEMPVAPFTVTLILAVTFLPLLSALFASLRVFFGTFSLSLTLPPAGTRLVALPSL